MREKIGSVVKRKVLFSEYVHVVFTDILIRNRQPKGGRVREEGERGRVREGRLHRKDERDKARKTERERKRERE